MYRIIFTNHFKRQLKKLAKKDSNLKAVLIKSLESLKPTQSIHLGRNIHKIRIRGGNKGKSSGYRVYLLVIEINKFLAPLCIYSKTRQANISEKELLKHVIRIKDELADLH